MKESKPSTDNKNSKNKYKKAKHAPKKSKRGPRGQEGKKLKRNRYAHAGYISKRQRRKQVRVAFVMLILMLIIFVSFLWYDYNQRPGILERSSLKATEQGTDHITIEWKGTRNTDTYTLYYREKGASDREWKKQKIEDSDRGREYATLEDLKEGTEYGVILRADNADRTGFSTKEKFFFTRTHQKIRGKKTYTKLTCSKDFKLGMKAATRMTYKSEDESVLKVTKKGKVKITGSGTAVIRVHAKATDKYISADTKVSVEVIAADPVTAGGAPARIIYSLGYDDCELVREIVGPDAADVPQSFDYTDKKFIIAYGMDDAQRIVTFHRNSDEIGVSTPSIALGHPNGFAYAESTGLCYCVRGWSGRCVTYRPETGEYGEFNLPYGASGIAYDSAEDRIYTSSRSGMVSYSIGENGYTPELRCGVVSHSDATATQDCGGHAGIMMRCLSRSESMHGINYVDLYDMKHGEYLGTISCDLSEVESATVDEDGYMLLLCNTTTRTDYILKTPINIEDIGAGLRSN